MLVCIAHEHKQTSNVLPLTLILVILVLQPDTSPTLQHHRYKLVYHDMCLFTSPSLTTKMLLTFDVLSSISSLHQQKLVLDTACSRRVKNRKNWYQLLLIEVKMSTVNNILAVFY